MKLKLWVFSLVITTSVFAQTKKDDLLKKDISSVVEEIEFMCGYAKAIRTYETFKSFDKDEISRIGKLSDSLFETIRKSAFVSENTRKFIWDNYIYPKDVEHTKRIIEITKKYGFPSITRIRKYYSKDFIDPDFEPFLLFMFSPKQYRAELKVLMKKEVDEGRIEANVYFVGE